MLAKSLTREIENTMTRETDKPGIDETVEYIECLMIWYCKKPSRFLANLIVSSLEELRAGELDGETAAGLWACQRLIRNWEYIAASRRHAR